MFRNNSNFYISVDLAISTPKQKYKESLTETFSKYENSRIATNLTPINRTGSLDYYDIKV